MTARARWPGRLGEVREDEGFGIRRFSTTNTQTSRIETAAAPAEQRAAQAADHAQRAHRQTEVSAML